MTFKPAIWYRIAMGLTAINLIGGGYALGEAEPSHALGHAALAIGFGLWALRLRRVRAEGESQSQVAAREDDRLEVLEDELTRLRQELSETQERLDFTERMLAQRPDPRRVEPRS